MTMSVSATAELSCEAFNRARIQIAHTHPGLDTEVGYAIIRFGTELTIAARGMAPLDLAGHLQQLAQQILDAVDNDPTPPPAGRHLQPVR